MARSKDDRTSNRQRGGGRGRGGSSSNGKGGPSREVDVSKKLSWLLRHGAEKEGLKLGTGGYIPLDKVLATQRFKSLVPRPTLGEIREITESSEKQRFSLIHISDYSDKNTQAVDAPDVESEQKQEDAAIDEDPSHWLIRANQGHSLKVEADGLLKPITLATGNLPQVVVHGTQHQKWNQILSSGGLKPMTRNHVHFATGVPKVLESAFKLQSGSQSKAKEDEEEEVPILSRAEGDDTATGPEQVKSGMRNSSTLLIFINLKAALEKGIKFWMSDNGVVLSEGNDNGVVPTEVFRTVIRKDGTVLFENGSVKN